MDDRSRLMAAQLARMRGMNRYYHGRFFSDVRFSAIALLALFVVGWWEVPEGRYRRARSAQRRRGRVAIASEDALPEPCRP
ncbi:MAG: hypothetical protein OEM22_03895 [Acidimicrobiia bacterium]|nr:hypothetical protein [Acidimicrobiia bacterium]